MTYIFSSDTLLDFCNGISIVHFLEIQNLILPLPAKAMCGMIMHSFFFFNFSEIKENEIHYAKERIKRF